MKGFAKKYEFVVQSSPAMAVGMQRLLAEMDSIQNNFQAKVKEMERALVFEVLTRYLGRLPLQEDVDKVGFLVEDHGSPDILLFHENKLLGKVNYIMPGRSVEENIFQMKITFTDLTNNKTHNS